jgi:hypothetical protein
MNDGLIEGVKVEDRGHRYLLIGADEARFRATGLDAAHRIKQRVTEAVEKALADDPEVIEVERKFYVRVGTPPCTGEIGCLANLHEKECLRRAR